VQENCETVKVDLHLKNLKLKISNNNVLQLGPRDHVSQSDKGLRKLNY